MNVFLDAPQDFANVCLVARTLETLGVDHCYVHDPNRLIRDRYGKSRTSRIQKVSAGAFFQINFERVEDPIRFLSELPGRKVATVPCQRATPLTHFEFLPDDTILFGSEGRGISEELLSVCDTRLTIPQSGITDSINLAVAVGIVLFENSRQATETI
ncbi:MAG: TrmH family RNA methyltransferase [Rubrobacteraceae bacterium]